MSEQIKIDSPKKLLRLFLTFVVLFIPCIKSTFASEKVVLQLSWKHQFQFAGYYAALEKGYYSEVGFNVTIKEADTSIVVLDEVLNGNADFAIGDAELLVSFIKGAPISIIACIYQHSPSVLLVKASSGINTPHDLVGKRLMVGEDLNGLEILTMLYNEGVNRSQIEIIPHSFSVNELLLGNVDGLGAYISNEPYFMEKFGIPYQLINPTNYGIDFYSDCLFTSQKKIKRNPDKVLKFQQASIKGWEYALANPEEIAKLITQKYNPSKTMDHLLYEAKEIKKLINPDFIEVGHINKWRWHRIGEQLFQQNIVSELPEIDNFIYTPNVTNKYIWVKAVTIILASILCLILILFLLHRWFNLSLNKKTIDYKLLVKKLEEQNSEINRINLELIKSKEQAAELERNRYFFITKIINELRTPANSLIDLTEQLRKPNIPAEKRKAICSRIVANSKIMSGFTNDIIAITDVEEKTDVNFAMLNLQLFFDTLIRKFKSEHKNPSLVNFNLVNPNKNENNSLYAIVNQRKLEQIISKLIENSLKFTEQGTIELGYELNAPTSLLLWVKDTGLGINPETLDKINDFFTNTTNHTASCIGLGLMVSKSIVSQMRGIIWAENNLNANEEVAGSKFLVTIPCTFIESTNDNESIIQNSSKNILVLDNHINDYNFIKIQLKNSGYNLLYSDSVDVTQEIIENFKGINVLLINAESDKLLTNNKIQELVLNKQGIPCIAYASHDRHDKKLFINYGFMDILQIPSLNQNLTEIIGRIILEKTRIA